MFEEATSYNQSIGKKRSNKENVVKSSQIRDNRNPILNSPDDITEELIQAIIDNNLDSLTINYEFTRAQFDKEDWDDWQKEQYRTNPFWAANKKVNSYV